MFLKIYKYLNILSIDVVIGACICSMFIADLLSVQLHPATTLLLGVSVWLIYTFDHLNDAKSIPHTAGTARHRFHQKHFRTLVFYCIGGLILASFLVFRIPAETVVWGAGLSCLVLGYFLLLYFLKLRSSYHKEFVIAALYASGIMIGPLSIYNGAVDILVVIIFLQFGLLAFTNLLTFAVYETHIDERDRSPSLVRITGKAKATVLLKVSVGMEAVIAVLLLFYSPFLEFGIIMLLMIMLLCPVVFFRRFFVSNDLYRIIGDAVFLVPLFGIAYQN